MTYDVGDIIESSVIFRNMAGEKADPTTVSLVIQAPDNTQTTVTGASITRDNTGEYHYDIPVTMAGGPGNSYIVRWVGTGAVTAVKEKVYPVTPTLLVPQPTDVPAVTATQANLNAINEAINSGVLRVQFADRAVTYRSLAELYSIKNSLLGQLAAATATPIRRQIRLHTNKGM